MWWRLRSGGCDFAEPLPTAPYSGLDERALPRQPAPDFSDQRASPVRASICAAYPGLLLPGPNDVAPLSFCSDSKLGQDWEAAGAAASAGDGVAAGAGAGRGGPRALPRSGSWVVRLLRGGGSGGGRLRGGSEMIPACGEGGGRGARRRGR